MLYANFTEPKREDIVRKLRELKKSWKKYKPNEKAVSHYRDLLSVDKFKETLKGMTNA
jgi:hypothetical protein